MDESERHVNSSPVATANPISKLFFWYVFFIMIIILEAFCYIYTVDLVYALSISLVLLTCMSVLDSLTDSSNENYIGRSSLLPRGGGSGEGSDGCTRSRSTLDGTKPWRLGYMTNGRTHL